MELASSYFWKEAPFTRLFLPFALGIIAQEKLHLSVIVSVVIIFLSLIGLGLLASFNSFNWYRRRHLAGMFLMALFFGCGSLQLHFFQRKLGSYITSDQTRSVCRVVLTEPLSEKSNSYKATGRLIEIKKSDSSFQTNERILIYFKKDSICKKLDYGDQLIFSKSFQSIRNSGNPGAFNYQEYCARQGIFQQVFLNSNDFILLKEKDKNTFIQFLINIRKAVIGIIQEYIPAAKEAGLAEALLIGYKDDLDKELVSAYSGAGVIHIIAISGLHMGIIYGLLNGIFLLWNKKRKSKWVKPIVIISGLWLFSLIAGSSASVLRSALMFTFIVIGDSLSRKVSIYNTLSASAFILLWYNPYWLWDVGFQLSYCAVLSIVIFYKHVYALLFFNNKIADAIWKLNAITISAQVLTLPLTIYYFHQFPTYFLLANLVAIPISSIILIGEILLCALAAIPTVAEWLGWLLGKLIFIMNSFIEWIDQLPGSVWNKLQIDQLQTILLFIAATGIFLGILIRNKKALFTGLACLSMFFLIRLLSFSTCEQQQKMIVYNIPGHPAIDFIQGRNYLFLGDSLLKTDGFLKNFHLDPSRTLNRIAERNNLPGFIREGNLLQFGSKKILLLDRNFKLSKGDGKINIDLIIVSENPSVKPKEAMKIFNVKKIIIDNSNNWWRINNWGEECRKAGLDFHRTDTDGAFVLNMQ